MKSDEVFFVCCVVMILAFFTGLCLGKLGANEKWRRDAIEHNFGRYNPTTANFEWITNQIKLEK